MRVQMLSDDDLTSADNEKSNDYDGSSDSDNGAILHWCLQPNMSRSCRLETNGSLTDKTMRYKVETYHCNIAWLELCLPFLAQPIVSAQ